MSWGGAKLPSRSPKVAGLDAADTATNEQAVPVPWWIGPDARPLTWIVPDVYNIRTVEIRQKVGKGKTQTMGYEYYGDVAGIAGLGVARRVWGIECSNKRVWSGNAVRPDDPQHPDYWRKHIHTSVGEFYIYWGRPDQPVDDILLGPLGAANAALKHPAYRNQVLVVVKNLYLGESGGSVPNIRVMLDRAPAPEVGEFPAQGHSQGESMLAGILELATNPIFGAGISTDRIAPEQWEAVSAAVMARAGRHAPSMDRGRPLRDVVRDLQSYYDGWCRLRNGMLEVGFYPHDGAVPDGLTELSVHDFTQRPRVRAGAPGKAVNDVVVIYRDRADGLKKKPVNESDSANAEARHSHDSRPLEMLGFVNGGQARAWAAEAAATGAEGEWDGELRVRRPRAVWASGVALQAGDNFQLDLIAPQVDQVSRITRRVDYFAGPPLLEYVAERGVYPTPYVPPEDLRPELGEIAPEAIAHARILELTPELAGSPLGLPISVLAKRPASAYDGIALSAASVLGFVVNFSETGASYDSVGTIAGWAVRGVLRESIAAGAGGQLVKITADQDNLDIQRVQSLSEAARANDSLLAVIDDELFSVGTVSVSGWNRDLQCLRARLGSRAAAHAEGAEVWIVWRDELRSIVHARFIEDETRYFKLQPYTSSAVLDLADADPLEYAFRDRAPERPVIVLGAMPANPVTGIAYTVIGTISDVNGDLTRYEVTAARMLDGEPAAEVSLRSGDVPPEERALFEFRAQVVFPTQGTWRIIARAYDEQQEFTRKESADITVTLNTGEEGPDDGLTPDAVTGVSVTAGFLMLWLEWTIPTNTPVAQVRIYESGTPVRPAQPTFVLPAAPPFFSRENLPHGATRYYWLQVLARNGRLSAIAGPFEGSTSPGVDLSHLVPGLTTIEIVGELPAVGNFMGRMVFLVQGTDQQKLYRWTHDSITTGTEHWTASVPAPDIDGQLIAEQIANDAVTREKILAGAVDSLKLANNAVTAAKVATGAIDAGKLATDAVTREKILAGAVDSLKLANNAVTAAKVAVGAIDSEKLAAGAVTAAKIVDGAIDDVKLAAEAVTAAKVAAGAITGTKIENGAISSPKIAAGAVEAGNIAAGAVVADKIAAGAVEADKIAASAVSAGKIAAGAITASKISSGAITAAKIASNAITAVKIAANAVNADKIAAGAVVADKIAAGAITAGKIAAGSVATDMIRTWAITAAKIDVGAVQATKIAAGAVTAEKVASDAITAGKIQAGAVVADKIAANAVTTTKIATNAITASKINVTTLSAITANVGLLRTATSGARMELAANQLRVYDSNGTLRVRLGLW